jgi:adenylate kinase family enzyme
LAGTAGHCYAALVARIHIVSASGSGTTTLGVALAREIDGAHFDTDDFFWLPTDPPFTTKRPVEQRLSLLEAELTRDSWVLSGSLMGWGDVLVPRFDLVVFLYVPPDVRLERIMERERRRYGADIDPGGRPRWSFTTQRNHGRLKSPSSLFQSPTPLESRVAWTRD